MKRTPAMLRVLASELEQSQRANNWPRADTIERAISGDDPSLAWLMTEDPPVAGKPTEWPAGEWPHLMTKSELETAREPDPPDGLPYPRDWVLSACLDRGPGHAYRYRTVGKHIDTDDLIRWDVRDLGWRYTM